MNSSSLFGLSVMVMLICSGGATRMLRQTGEAQMVLTMEGQFVVAGAVYTLQALNNLAGGAGLGHVVYVGKTTLPSVTYGSAHLLTYSLASASSALSSTFTTSAINTAIASAEPSGATPSVVRSLVVTISGVVAPVTASLVPVPVPVLSSPSPSTPSPSVPSPPPPPPKGDSVIRPSPASSAPLTSSASPSPTLPVIDVTLPPPASQVVVVTASPSPIAVSVGTGSGAITVAVTLAGQPLTTTNIYVMLAIMDLLTNAGMPGDVAFVGKTTLPSIKYGSAYIANYEITDVASSAISAITSMVTASAINGALASVLPATVTAPVAKSVASTAK